MTNIKSLETIIGVLSYASRCIRNLERILGPLQIDLKKWKAQAFSRKEIKKVQKRVEDAYQQALYNLEWLNLPGAEADEYVVQLESDWSLGYSGYMLFVKKIGEEHLVDLGSRAHKHVTSSYLGELESIVWAWKRTKALQGSVPLTIRTDSHNVIDKIKSGKIYDLNIRAFKRWRWLVQSWPPGSVNSRRGLPSINIR